MLSQNIFFSAFVAITFGAFTVIGESAIAGQEFNCEVFVENNQVESGRSQIFDDIEEELEEFINQRSWTSLDVQRDERIECNLTLTITEWNRDADQFEGNLQVQAARPVYNSGYNTTTINHLDEDIEFDYGTGHRLEFAEGSHVSEISSVMAYYLFFILGLEMDAMSLEGGTPFFRLAQDVVNSAQASNAPGWSARSDSRSRFGLVDEILRDRNRNYRKAWYEYHREGLDYLSEDPQEGRKNLLNALSTLREFHQRDPNAYLLRMFFRAKSSEIMNAFSQAGASERSEVLDLLQNMDPRNSSEYRSRLR